MKYILLIGRILFSLQFLTVVMSHFSSMGIQYATSAGVPIASVLVPLSGVIALLGAISIIIGYKAKIGAWLIVIFLVPVTFMMHKFWTVSDQMASMMQMVMFTKNISMLGGALIIAYFGSGPLSIDYKAQTTSGETKV